MSTPRRIPDRHYPGGEFDWECELRTEQEDSSSAIEVLERADVEGSALKLFLRISEHSPRRVYIAREIAAICSVDCLSQIRDKKYPDPDPPLAWLDVRSGKGEAYTTSTGWVGCSDLYSRLSRARSAGQLEDGKGSGPPEARRQLIYIPNPKDCSLAPIMLRASTTQAPILRDFLWKHLKAEKSIQVGFTIDRRMFSMQFHLPFFVWKRHRDICTDSRKRSDGTPLRKSIDLSILGGGDFHSDQGSRKDCLYESQVSFVATGHSNSAWVGYSFVDTFFHLVEDEGEDEGEGDGEDAAYNDTDIDSVDHYNDVEWEGGTLNLDPITAGNFDADHTIWDPREYFLVVLKERMRQVEEHWQNVAYSLRRKIERDIQNPGIPISPEEHALGAAQEQCRAAQKSYERTKATSKLLLHLIATLDQTIDVWNRFNLNQFSYFYEPGLDRVNAAGTSRGPRRSTSRWSFSFREVENTFGELHHVLVDLKKLNDQYENFKQQFELYLLVENSRATIVLQHWNVTFMLIISPPALATGILQSGIVPFQPTWGVFLALTLIFALVANALRPALSWYWRRFQRSRSDPEATSPPDQTGSRTPRFQDTLRRIRFPRPTFSPPNRDRNYRVLFRLPGKAVEPTNDLQQ